MPSDPLYWSALAAFGLAALAQGVAGLAAAGGIGAWVTVAGGLAVLVAAAAALVRDGETAGPPGGPTRWVAVGGALLYAGVTVVDLLG